MAGRVPDSGFFVGYVNTVPRPLAVFLVVVAALLIGSMAGLGYALGTNANDPGDGTFARKLGKQEMTGVLLEKPYPILPRAPGRQEPRGRTVMLTVPGKRQRQGAAAASSSAARGRQGLHVPARRHRHAAGSRARSP